MARLMQACILLVVLVNIIMGAGALLFNKRDSRLGAKYDERASKDKALAEARREAEDKAAALAQATGEAMQVQASLEATTKRLHELQTEHSAPPPAPPPQPPPPPAAVVRQIDARALDAAKRALEMLRNTDRVQRALQMLRNTSRVQQALTMLYNKTAVDRGQFTATLSALSELAKHGRAGEPPASDSMVKVPLDLARFPTAVCNDGSPGAYYITEAKGHQGHAATRDVWLIFLQGGGWCWDAASCAARHANEPGLMSSDAYPPARDATGIFSPDPALSPFATANKVYVPYCSSDAFVGNIGKDHASAAWHFRGQDLIAATLDVHAHTRARTHARTHTHNAHTKHTQNTHTHTHTHLCLGAATSRVQPARLGARGLLWGLFGRGARGAF